VLTSTLATPQADDSGALRFVIGPSNSYVPQGFPACYWPYGQMVGLYLDEFEIRRREEFNELYDAGMAAFVTFDETVARSTGTKRAVSVRERQEVQALPWRVAGNS
jgi:hypothetical protein